MHDRIILWTPHNRWRARGRVVWVDVAKLDASWRKDQLLWLPPGSAARFGRWLAQQSPCVRVVMPEIGWVPGVVRDARGGQANRRDGRHHVVFLNGRNRTAWMRDNGATALPVLVDIEQADVIATEIGTTERATTVTMLGPELREDPGQAQPAKALGAVMVARAG